jgi:hypothetical protein
MKIDPGRGLLNVIKVLLPCRGFCYRGFMITLSDPGLSDVGFPAELRVGQFTEYTYRETDEGMGTL